MRSFGFSADDFVVRVSSRDAWLSFVLERFGQLQDTSAVNDAQFRRLLEILDKLERQDEKVTNAQLQEFNASVNDVYAWIHKTQRVLKDPTNQEWLAQSGTTLSNIHQLVHQHIIPLGLKDVVEIDLGIVRGLAYYTGIVFEVFSRKRKLRAIAGGGRYDNLISQLSDGAVSLPALGFAMGDVVLSELINEIPRAREAMQKAITSDRKIDIYVVIAKEERRADALAQIQQLRDRGYRVDYPMTPTKVARQFQAAEEAGASLALLYGDEWPQVKVKNLPTREESLIDHGALLDSVAKFFNVGSSA